MYETRYYELYTRDGLGRMGEIMPALVAACPGFVPWSEAYVVIRGTAPHSDAGLFAEYLVEAQVADDRSCVSGAFAAVERLLETADVDIEAVIQGGLFEPMVGMLLDAGLTTASIRGMLGPRTAHMWEVVLEEPAGED